MYHMLQNAVVQEIITLMKRMGKNTVELKEQILTTITSDFLSDIGISTLKLNRGKLEFYSPEEPLPFEADDMTFSSLVDIYDEVFKLTDK